jgi:small subunit ribosomal protein S17
MADESPEMNDETAEATEAAAEGAEVEAEGGAESESTAAETPAAEEEPAAEGAAEPTAGEAGSEPAEEVLTPKERRRRQRSTHTGVAREPRSAQERREERLAERAVKARHRRAVRAKQRAKRAETGSAAGTPKAQADGSLAAADDREAARKVRQGVVLSNKADKTITVRIGTARRHRRYEKIVRSSSTLHAHDEQNEAHEGDVVRVIESRPLSRNKRWRLVEVVERAR